MTGEMAKPAFPILARILLAALVPLLITLGAVLFLVGKAGAAFSTLALASLAGFVVTGVSAFLVARSIVKPIKRITRNAVWIAGGNLDVFMDDFGRQRRPRHEIDQLEAAIGKMLTDVNAAHQSLLAVMEEEHESELARLAHDVVRRAPRDGGDGKERPQGDVEELLAGVAALRGALERGNAEECREVLDGMSRRYFGEETEADLLEIRGFVERRGFRNALNFLESRFGW